MKKVCGHNKISNGIVGNSYFSFSIGSCNSSSLSREWVVVVVISFSLSCCLMMTMYSDAVGFNGKSRSQKVHIKRIPECFSHKNSTVTADCMMHKSLLVGECICIKVWREMMMRRRMLMLKLLHHITGCSWNPSIVSLSLQDRFSCITVWELCSPLFSHS